MNGGWEAQDSLHMNVRAPRLNRQTLRFATGKERRCMSETGWHFVVERPEAQSNLAL